MNEITFLPLKNVAYLVKNYILSTLKKKTLKVIIL